MKNAPPYARYITLLVDRPEAGVLRLTMNRPERLNEE